MYHIDESTVIDQYRLHDNMWKALAKYSLAVALACNNNAVYILVADPNKASSFSIFHVENPHTPIRYNLSLSDTSRFFSTRLPCVAWLLDLTHIRLQCLSKCPSNEFWFNHSESIFKHWFSKN
jgi:hypothetical protein